MIKRIPSKSEIRVSIARAYGAALGLRQIKGGWIVTNSHSLVLCQGWLLLYRRNYSHIWWWINKGISK